MPRAETEKPIHIHHDLDLVEVQGTQGNQLLPITQLIGYIYESED